MLKPSYTFADIGLVPTEVSDIRSRDDIDTTTSFLGMPMSLPLLASPMETVVDANFAICFAELGGLAFLPRTSQIDRDLAEYDKVVQAVGHAAIPSIGTGQLKLAEAYVKRGARHLCIDVANGAHVNVLETVEQIHRLLGGEIQIVTGNVASKETYAELAMRVDAVRVGIGNGSVCSTSIATGVGVGQVTAIRKIHKDRSEDDYIGGCELISDGGVKTPGDFAKALALGADFVMCGSIFAGCTESAGLVMHGSDGRPKKEYAGQASAEVKGHNRYVEGVQRFVDVKGSLKDIWKRYEDGLRSAMAYMNCKNLQDLYSLTDRNFTLLSPSAKAERQIHV